MKNKIPMFIKSLPKFLCYKIQIGKGKGSYKTKYTSKNWSQAYLLYNGINIGNGYKKRCLEVCEGKTTTIYRDFSI